MNLLSTPESKKRVFKLDFAFTPKQREIEASPARFKIVRAGRKFGKTTYSMHKALQWLRKPNSTVWSISPTYKQAKLISWSEFKRLIPQEAFGKKPNDTDLVITLKNGSQLYLMGSDDPDSLRGPAPNGVIFEEAAFHKREAWYEVVRPNLMPSRAPALFIGTPKGYNWFKDLEDEARRLISQGSDQWAVFHFSSLDNPHISREELDDAKRGCDSEAVWRQEYLAEYESTVGRVFAAFDGTVGGRHCRKIDGISGDCYRGIDWGLRDNTACVWGFVRGGKLYCYREYAGNNLSAPAQAKIILNLSPRSERVLRTALSHDAAKEDPTKKGLTVLWHFRNAGLENVQLSTRDKKNSRAMLTQLFQENRIVIDPDQCPKLRKQLLAYEWKDTTMEKPDDEGDDDYVDALHYLVEMLQFDLFIKPRPSEKDNLDNIYAQIARERLEQWRNPRTNVPSIWSEGPEFGEQCENTPGGYA